MKKTLLTCLYTFLLLPGLFGQTYQDYLNSALKKSELGDYSSAIDLCSKAIALETDSIQAYFYRAGFHVALIQKKDATADYEHYKSAISDYSRVLELDNYHAEALFFRGGAHSSFGVLDSAKEDYIASLSIDNNQSQVHNSLAVIYARRRNTLKATEHIDKAIALDPNYAKGYANKGNILSMRGQNEKACESWGKAIELGYSQGESRYKRMCK